MNIFGDDDYNYELKEKREMVTASSHEVFPEAPGAAEALHEVDEEIRARLEGRSPLCS